MSSPSGQPLGTRTITVSGQRLRIAIRSGDGTRPPLLVMNGLGANLELLRPFVEALDPAIEVLCFDVPGVGGSPPPALPYRFVTLAWLVVRMLDQLGYAQVDVLGISWGGGLAQQFAVQHGTRCRRLVLGSTAMGALMVPGRPAGLAAVIGVPHASHGEEVKAFIIRKAGATITEAELMAWCKETVAAYKYPRVIEFRDSLPMTATGKILKRELK